MILKTKTYWELAMVTYAVIGGQLETAKSVKLPNSIVMMTHEHYRLEASVSEHQDKY